MQETTADAPVHAAASAPATGYQPLRAWTITGWLAVLSVINFLDKVVLGLVAVPLMHDLQLSPAQFGLIAGSFFWLFSLSSALVGFLGNRLQARWLLLGMALVWTVAQLPVALAASATTLLAARIVLGAGEGPAFPISVHALYKWFPHDRRNLPVTVINQGAALGLLLAGLLVPTISARWGWRMNFLLLAVASTVWALGWLACGREGTLRSAATDDRSGLHGLRLPYRRLLTDPTLLCGACIGFSAYWSLALTLTWFPAYLQQGLGYPAATAGRVFALVVACGVPVSLGLSWFSQHLMRRGATSRTARAVFAVVCVAIGGVTSLLLPWLHVAPAWKVAVLAGGGLFPPLAFAVGPAIIGEIVPDAQRSGVMALYVAAITSAGAVAPLVMGRLLQSAADRSHAYDIGFFVSGAVLLTGALIALIGQHPERSRQRLYG